ncbi:MAG: hypothetical protein IPJ69_06785 [Deltaproteobacteria bacterium]|nr:MAG: hypothetical protein IPJ69_06785 [Deltaproteobacteria bacterium]
MTPTVIQMLRTLHFEKENPEVLQGTLRLISQIQNKSVDSSLTRSSLSQALLSHPQDVKTQTFYQRLKTLANGLLFSQTVDKKEDLVNYLSFSLQENPDHFDQELISLTFFQKNKIDLSLSQKIMNVIEPVRVALILAKLKKLSDPAALQEFVKDLKKVQDRPDDLRDLIEKMEIEIKPSRFEAPEDLPFNTHFLNDKTLYIPQGKKEYVSLQALGFEGKVVHPDQITGLDPSLISWNASLLATSQIPAGLHHLKAHFKDEEGDGWFDFWLYILKEYGDEEPSQKKSSQQDKESEEKKNEKREEKKETVYKTPYDSVSLNQSPEILRTPVLGKFEFQVKSPYVFVKPYNPKQIIPAPLQVGFHFLVDWVNPDTRYSRQKFLNFSESEEVKVFRSSLHELSREFLSAYPLYQKSLETLLSQIKTFLPPHFETWGKVERFLKEEVVLYLLGKKIEDQEFKIMEKSPRGDVLAAVCGTAANLLALTGHIPEALVSFKDAVDLSHSKPYYLKKIETFFDLMKHKTPFSESNLGPWPMIPDASVSGEFAKAKAFAKYAYASQR